MIVRSIVVRRDGDWGGGYPTDLSKPLRAVIEVQGQHGKVELTLSDDLSRQVIEIVAAQVADAGRATAEAMTAEILTQAALPAPEAA